MKEKGCFQVTFHGIPAHAEFYMRSYNTAYLYTVMERVKKTIAGAAPWFWAPKSPPRPAWI